MNIKEYRLSKKITIDEASKVAGVPRRTFIRYENDNEYGNALKRSAIISALTKKYEINEENGVLKIEQIKNGIEEVFNSTQGNIEFCYLFGSYAKGYANERSDIDLLIATDIAGLSFVNLINEISCKLHKKIDLIRLSDIENNLVLLTEIMKDGIKIYG